MSGSVVVTEAMLKAAMKERDLCMFKDMSLNDQYRAIYLAMHALSPVPAGDAVAWRMRAGGQNLWGYAESEQDIDFYIKQSGAANHEKQPLYLSPEQPVEATNRLTDRACLKRPPPDERTMMSETDDMCWINDKPETVEQALEMLRFGQISADWKDGQDHSYARTERRMSNCADLLEQRLRVAEERADDAQLSCIAAEEERELLRKRAEAAELALANALRLLKRYRTETPLGHQPHMIAHEADAAIAQEQK